MAEYHIGCGAFAIYAGTLNAKNKNLWQNKTECTDEAINAVRCVVLAVSMTQNDLCACKTLSLQS